MVLAFVWGLKSCSIATQRRENRHYSQKSVIIWSKFPTSKIRTKKNLPFVERSDLFERVQLVKFYHKLLATYLDHSGNGGKRPPGRSFRECRPDDLGHEHYVKYLKFNLHKYYVNTIRALSAINFFEYNTENKFTSHVCDPPTGSLTIFCPNSFYEKRP